MFPIHLWPAGRCPSDDSSIPRLPPCSTADLQQATEHIISLLQAPLKALKLWLLRAVWKADIGTSNPKAVSLHLHRRPSAQSQHSFSIINRWANPRQTSWANLPAYYSCPRQKQYLTTISQSNLVHHSQHNVNMASQDKPFRPV